MKQKNLVLMVVAVGCGLVAAFLTTQINAKPKVELVEVMVATRDLPVGTTISEEEFAKLVETKPMAKDILPPQFATTKEDLIGKRLSRPVLKGETFSQGSLVKGQVVTLPPGKDLYSFPMTARDGAGGFVGPGSKVDILAGLRLENKLLTFPLLVDMHVVAVNQHLAYDGTKTGGFPDMNIVALAVDQEEALLLTLAKQRGCTLSLLLRHEGKPRDASYDMEKVRQMLEDDKNPAENLVTEVKGGDGSEIPSTPFPMGVPGTSKKTVKVWVAKENIPANTTLTGDLVATKFTQVERPTEYSEDACEDLGKYYTKALVHGIAKGQFVTYWMVGEQPLKDAPQDQIIVGIPKPGATEPEPTNTQPDPGVVPTRAAPEIHDVAMHTPSGTRIIRYQRIKGQWKQVALLTPEQAARSLEPAASDKPATSDSPPAKQPEGAKN